MHCSHHTDLLLFSLNLAFDLFVSTRKHIHQIFGERSLNCFFTSTVYFSYSAFLRILSVSCDFWWENTKGGDMGGSNLGANYNSANNTQKKGVSWYRCSLKIGKISEKYTWSSSSLVNQQVESLQNLTLFHP